MLFCSEFPIVPEKWWRKKAEERQLRSVFLFKQTQKGISFIFPPFSFMLAYILRKRFSTLGSIIRKTVKKSYIVCHCNTNLRQSFAGTAVTVTGVLRETLWSFSKQLFLLNPSGGNHSRCYDSNNKPWYLKCTIDFELCV